MALSIILNALTSQLWAVTEAATGLASYKLEYKKAQNEAISSMRKALNKTRMFLKDPDFSNKQELLQISDLWNSASEKVGVLDKNLGITLGDKSRFWSDHELFISLGRDKEIIPLNDVVSEIERIYSRMK